jgi:hypothetical protein
LIRGAGTHLELSGVGVERHQLLVGPVVHRQLDDGPARDVPSSLFS